MEEGPKSGGENNIHQFFTKLLTERDARIKELESAMAQKSNLTQPSDWEQRYELLHQEHQKSKHETQVELNSLQSRINGLNTTITHLQREKAQHMQTVPVGNGTRLEWGLGVVGLLTGILLGVMGGMWFQKRISIPKNDQTRAFEKIQTKHQFNFEYEIANGRFKGIDSILVTELADPENASIQPELEFLQQVLKASKKKMEQHNVPMSNGGYTILPDDRINASAKYKGSLTVTEPTLTVRGEANTTSDKLGTLKEGDVVKIVDRAHRIDKLTTRYEGKRAEVEDIWYKIEMPNGMEGWVFGYYTSASRQSMIVFADSGDSTGAKVTPAAKTPTTTTPVKPTAQKDTVKVIVPAKKPN
jgi:hypothetical protein